MSGALERIVRRVLGVSAYLLVAALNTQAALEWERKDVKLDVLPLQVSCKADFPFTNSGMEPVTIQQLKPSCGCLKAEISKRTFAPGEKGTVEILFNLKRREGKQIKTTLVTTSDGEQCELTLETDIPKAYIVDPLFLKWEKGSGIKTKTTRLVNQNKTPIVITSAISSDKNLSIELKAIREGFEYEVDVTRTNSDPVIRQVVTLETRPQPGLDTSQSLQFFVLAP